MKGIFAFVVYVVLVICIGKTIAWIFDRASRWWYARKYQKHFASRKEMSSC